MAKKNTGTKVTKVKDFTRDEWMLRGAIDCLANDIANVDLTPNGPFYVNVATRQLAVGIAGGGFYYVTVPTYVGDDEVIEDAEYIETLPYGFDKLKGGR